MVQSSTLPPSLRLRHLWPIADQIDYVAREQQQAKSTAVDILAPYRSDCAAFIHEQVIIDDAQPDGDAEDALTLIPFHLWDAQRALLSDILTERLLLILKARQLGISWLVCAYALWLCLFRAGRVVLMFSMGQAEANELLRRVTVMYYRLPAELRAVLPAVTKENTGELAWANGSRVQSLPATKNAGSSYTASLVILDEFAKAQWATELYTAVKPTIDGGGKMIMLSSAQGTGNLFHELCERAQAGLSRFIFRFLPWMARPGRDQTWYDGVAADAVMTSLMGQEYPATPEEAFSASDVTRFLPSMALWDACQQELPPWDADQPLVIALDAGVSNDTFACVGTTRDPAQADHVLARLVLTWTADGTPLDFIAIEREIAGLVERCNVVQICYDPYQLHEMAQRLAAGVVILEDGSTARSVWCKPFQQAADRLTADKGLLDLTVNRRLGHDGNAVLRKHIDNANRKVDAESRKLRIVKRIDHLKIDAAVALSMSAHRCLELNIW